MFLPDRKLAAWLSVVTLNRTRTCQQHENQSNQEQSEAITWEKQISIAEQQIPSSQQHLHMMMANYAELCSEKIKRPQK
jgi:hypothetical protein